VHDERYVGIDGSVPRAESLANVIDRMLPYWKSDIIPDTKAGHTVLVTAHGNGLRALVVAAHGSARKRFE
jgi:2,3-bisphosphoglycerate-dependent phosphoglycerate mutase